MSEQQQLTRREQSVSNALEIEGIRNQLTDLLASDPRRMAAFKTKMLEASMSQMLKKCSPESIIACGLKSLTLDLPLIAGQGYIVAYKNQAQLDIGFKGFQVLAKRSGYTVMADTVYNCDMFEQSGFGFNAKIEFEPNAGERKPHDDKWARNELKGVIVSVREDATGHDTVTFVDAGQLFKIMGMSPGANSDYSPYKKWFDQMMRAKAIKQVLSKVAIDLSKASMLNDAIQVINSNETQMQQEPQGLPEYPQSRFDENWPKWVDIVSTNKKPAVTIITQLVNGFKLTEGQMKKVMTLSEHEPIEGEIADELVPYDDKDFKEAYAGWQESVESGQTSPDDLIADLQDEYALTEKQLGSLSGLHDCVPVEAS